MLSALSVVDFQKRARWYVGVRWFYVLGIGLPSVAAIIAAYGYQGQAGQDIGLLSLILIINGLFLVSTFLNIRHAAVQRTLVIAQIVFDLALMSAAFYLNRGGESPLPIFFAIPIIMTAAFFGRGAIYATGCAVAGIYLTLSMLDYSRILPVQHIAAPQLHTDPQLFFPPLVITVTTFLAITVITGLVGRLIREREKLADEMRILSARNALTEAILRTMGSALVAINREGNITLVNDNFELLTGWRRAEVVGRPLDSVLPLIDTHSRRVPAAHRPMLQFITDNASAKLTSFRSLSGYSYRRKDGTVFPFSGNVAPIIAHNEVIGFTTVFDDASDAKKLNQLKDNFIALISHQLKTPIGEINGFAYNLLGGVAGKMNAKQTDYVTQIQELAGRSGKLIADLLDIVLAGQGTLTVQKEPVDIAPVIDEVVKLHKAHAKQKGLELTARLPDTLVYVRGDEHKLVQAIGNLVANAISYTDKGEVTVAVEPAEDVVEIYVRDSGRGMDQAVVEAIFSTHDSSGPLAHAPTAEGGTGLGVYLAKQLIALMDGSIYVASSNDQGTTIRVTLGRV